MNMRSIYFCLVSLFLLCFSGVSNAAAYSWFSPTNANVYGDSPMAACIKMNSGSATGMTFVMGGAAGIDGTCLYNGVSYNGYIQRRGDSCPVSGQTYNTSTGVCNCPSGTSLQGGQCVSNNPCAAGADTPTGWKKEWASFDAYNSDSGKPKCQTSQNGCAVDICGDNGTMQCGQSGSTGAYACFGNGTYTGDQQDASEGGDVDGCEGAACQPPPPVTSSSEQSCTPNVNGSFTCVKNDVSSQFSGSECTVGSVGGSTGYVCVKPDYVPESHDKTTEDVVTETTNPDGSKTTVTETTTTHTTCKAGVCTTTTTTTTNTQGTNPDGSPGDSSTVCTGDKCDNPATEKDESKEEEEEEAERTVAGEDCGGTLSCEGDAIDCAILRQQKEMRCSLDWDTHKGAVLSEASKSEYQLQEDEIDASGLFSGPSASRWLPSSCPADIQQHLSSINGSVSMSYAPICQYAGVFGYLFVFSASVFFAVYVGRSFGG